MPWKNGGGLTTELFQLPGISVGSFLIRLSCAEISTDGPFSFFPNLDRILILIEGNGFILKSSKRHVELSHKLEPIKFKGEEVFSCALIDGPCVDFNIMTDRNFANAKISFLLPDESGSIKILADCDLKFIYDIKTENLYSMENRDEYNLEVFKGSSMIVIDINRL